jgi:hypothetical protein
MAFNPKAFNAMFEGAAAAPPPPRNGGGGGGFDPRAFNAMFEGGGGGGGGGDGGSPPIVDEPQRAKRGMLESFTRGAAQGVTLGFADELTGAADWLTGGDYQKTRDESRAAYKESQQDNPWSYGAGELGSAFVPGFGVAKAASLGAKVARGAAMGAASNVGYEDNKGVGDISLGNAAIGAATGAAFGGISEGISRKLRQAPERVEKRIMQGITEGGNHGIAKKLVGRAGDYEQEAMKVVRAHPAIEKAAIHGNTKKLAAATDAAREASGAQIGHVYDVVDGTGETLAQRPLSGMLDKEYQKLMSDPSTRGIGKALYSEIDNVWESWGGRKDITARELRKTVTNLQNDAKSYYQAAVNGTTPPDGAIAKKLAADMFRDALHEHVEKVAGKHGVGVTVAELKAMNQRHSILINLDNIAATKATREATAPPRRLGWLFDVGLLAADPMSFVGKKVLIDSGVARHLTHAADMKLAKYVNAARQGSTAAELKLMAAQIGLSGGAAMAVNRWARRQFADSESAPEAYAGPEDMPVEP